MRRTIVALVCLLAASAGCGAKPPRSEAEITTAGSPPRAPSRSGRARDAGSSDTSATADDWRVTYRAHPALRSMSGAASYYHDSLAGNSTASGEPYDPREYTAASRDLPFGTVLRVVRVDTGASVIVRVNDRGPFGRRQRLLDLSRAAAEQLDMIARGVIDVRAEVLEDGPPRTRRRR